jgi:hypothetical protein
MIPITVKITLPSTMPHTNRVPDVAFARSIPATNEGSEKLNSTLIIPIFHQATDRSGGTRDVENSSDSMSREILDESGNLECTSALVRACKNYKQQRTIEHARARHTSRS